MNLRQIAILLALATTVLAGIAAYVSQSWMPLIMASPVVLIVLSGALRRPKG